VQFAQVIRGIEYELTLNLCTNIDPEIYYVGNIFQTVDYTGLGRERVLRYNDYTFPIC